MTLRELRRREQIKRKTKPLAPSPQRLAAQRANGSKPQTKATKSERELRTLARHEVATFLLTEAKDKAIRLMRETEDPELYMAFFKMLGDRFGLPVLTEQSVKMEMAEGHVIRFEMPEFDKPGAVQIQ